jgi:glycosyltransferase involved in cell wall biosynthesis
MKYISFVTTVYNEENTISSLLESLFNQTCLPDEVIIVDGDSHDTTVKRIRNFLSTLPKNKSLPKVHLISKPCNRSEGRNLGIKMAKGEIIVLTDAGCVLDKHWVEKIVKPFANNSVDAVAGYYAGRTQSIFQQCQIPYFLVMPDQLNPKHFLPATRSMAIKKQVWEELGGFPEEYSHNEDYVFAKKLKKMGKKIVFAGDAIVYWIPKKTLKDCFLMFFRHAYGDAEARILRPKVVFIFFRYFIVLLLMLSSVIFRLSLILKFFIVFFLIYIVWSIKKNIKYCSDIKAFFYFPILQLTADLAIIAGTLGGIFLKNKIKRGKI